MAKTIKHSANLAKLLIEIDAPQGTKIYVIKSPIAGTEHAEAIRSKRVLYGVEFTEGVGVTTDAGLAAQISAEFPDYIITEA